MVKAFAFPLEPTRTSRNIGTITRQTKRRPKRAVSSEEIKRRGAGRSGGVSVRNPRISFSIDSMQRQSPWQHSSPAASGFHSTPPLAPPLTDRVYTGARRRRGDYDMLCFVFFFLPFFLTNRASTVGAPAAIHSLAVFFFSQLCGLCRNVFFTLGSTEAWKRPLSQSADQTRGKVH